MFSENIIREYKEQEGEENLGLCVHCFLGNLDSQLLVETFPFGWYPRNHTEKARGATDVFFNWLKRECHYSLRRAGWEWDGQKFQKEGKEITPEAYNTLRERGLKAIVERAIDFFKDKGEERKLMGSLEL